MKKSYDVIVAGSGPSGLAIASAMANQGLKTVCVSPTIDKSWENNSCAWATEIRPFGFDKYCDRIWPKTEIVFADGKSKVMDGAYAHFDNDKLRNALLKDVKEKISGEAVSVNHDKTGSDLKLKKGDKIRAAIIIDATGHDHSLIKTLKKEADAFQNVYGILACVDSHPYNLESMILMDFRSEHLEKNVPPTFLYAMPWEKDLVFLEETSLVASPGVPLNELKRRLDLRIKNMGLNIKEIELIESGILPMNMPLPDLKQRVIGFGSAGGFVHHSTGWSIARSLRLSDPVAELVARGLNNGDDPDTISTKAWKLMWPPDELRMRRFHLMGMNAFCHLGINALSFFMKFFFALPGTAWQQYLSNDATYLKVNKALLNRKQ